MLYGNSYARIMVTIVLGGLLLICLPSLNASTEKAAQTAAASPLPPGVTFRILEATRIKGVKCSLTVLLSAKVSPEALKSLALRLRASEDKNYPRMFIVYYLPGMSLDGMAWATSHFNPDLKIEILGATTAQEHTLVAAAKAVNRNAIGKWFDPTPYTGGTITILRKRGKILLECHFPDGSSFTGTLRERASPHGRRFDHADGKANGDYYVLTRDGKLEIYSRDGSLVQTALPIR